MIKKTFHTGLALLVFASVLSADWKTELAEQLGRDNNFRAALTYLRDHFPQIDAPDKQNALGLLPFLARMAGTDEDEKKWIVEYFETHGDALPVCDFLDDSLQRSFVEYWAGWESDYPLITEPVLLVRKKAEDEDKDKSPPAWIEVGFNLLNGAFYRISASGEILEGGAWPGGFHILRLPLQGHYDVPGSLVFNLDLKTKRVVVRKPLTIRVDVLTIQSSVSLPPVRSKPPQSVGPRPIEGELSLYVDDRLILTSKKLSSKPAPLIFKIPGPSAPGTKPYMAPNKNHPMMNSASIIDAVNAAYSLLKSAAKRKKTASFSPPVYQKTSQRVFSFSRPGPDGREATVQSTVSLKSGMAMLADN